MVQIHPSALMTLQNVPLVKTLEITGQINSGSVFFGVGLMTSEQLGENLPFDILGMFFSTELIRRTLNLDSAIIVLGDAHAISNNLFPPEAIKQFADKTERELQKIIHNFALTNFKILRACNFHNNSEFQTILNLLPKMNNEYLRLEIADCLFLKQTENLKLKVGWTMSKTEKIEGNDERFFDAEIKKFIPDLNFINLEPGWTMDPTRPRVSPYISLPGENRLILKTGQEISDLGVCGPHVAKIVRCAEILWGKLPFVTLEEKVSFLVDKATF